MGRPRKARPRATGMAAARSRWGPTAAGARLVVLALLASSLTGGVDRKAARLNRDGNRLYDGKHWDDAAKRYDDAQTRAPEAPEIAYNLGNVLFRQGKYADAAPLLRRAAESEQVPMRAQSLYNLGNALHHTGNLKEAVESYKRALDLVPSDLDTKINYEKAVADLRQQQQKKQQQQQNQDKKQDQKQQDEQQSGQGQDQKDQQQQSAPDQQDQEKQRGQEQQEQQEKAGADSLQSQQQQMAASDSAVAAGDLRPEEALRILEAMREH